MNDVIIQAAIETHINLLTTDDECTYLSCNFGRTLSVGAICFEDRFCASKKGGIGGGGRVSPRSAVHMTAALTDCRKALVSTGLVLCGHTPFWPFLSFLTQMGVNKAPLPF